MKTSELRIGNLVETPREIENIVEIHRNHLMFSPLRESPYITYHIDLTKPVHLTEEWLLKLGFNKHEIKIPKDLIDGNEIVLIGHYWENGKKFRIYDHGEGLYMNNYPIFTYIKYVHQLQNLYFSMVMEELRQIY